ncbi:MAG: hypothetical protein PVS3B3_13830 [Ktedonobacteraceae bacterium]
MTVYVDDIQPYGRSATWRHNESCHMFCDGPFEELHTLAEEIGLKLAWFQTHHPRPDLWHYDVTRSKRALAVQHGAVEITGRQYSAMIHEAIQRQKSGILRHACGCREEHTDLLDMPEQDQLKSVRERMRRVCSACIAKQTAS